MNIKKIFSLSLILFVTLYFLVNSIYLLNDNKNDAIAYKKTTVQNFEKTIFFPNTASFGSVVHTPLHAKKIKSIGVKWVRLDINWSSIERERGKYNFSKFDLIINDFTRNEINIILILNIYEKNPVYSIARNKYTGYEGFSNFINALVSHYGNKVSIWEIGNEPEGDPNKIYTNPKNYTLVARGIAKKIRKINPNAHIAALSTAWIDRPFIKECLVNGLLSDKTIDVISFHGYHRTNIMPESGLYEDVTWLRQMVSKYKPLNKNVIVIDSERGYAVSPFLSPKPKDNYRNIVYSEEEQAAYLARHYLEEISLGIEISIWYKDMWGENAFSFFEAGENSRVRPMGYVMKHLSEIFTENPKEMYNSEYSINILPNKTKNASQVSKLVYRSYLIHKNKSRKTKKLIIAIWKPIEAFNKKILESRIHSGEYVFEKWRNPNIFDSVKVSAFVSIPNLNNMRIKKISLIDFLSPYQSSTRLLNSVRQSNNLLIGSFEVSSTPTIIEVEIL
jgi:Cellulase (glycosyl hydrolase family 5)